MAAIQLRHGLDVHPSVVFQLGERLISDEITAIVELVKNSYDADARWCRVLVDSDYITTEETFFPGCHGQIVIEDDGTGMDLDELERGWLTISYSAKLEAKQSGRISPRHGRTPLGDKGLGRLGAQRLGQVLEVFTTKTTVDPDSRAEVVADERLHLGIDWRDLPKHEALSQVPISFEGARNPHRQKGTRVIVSELREPAVWSSEAITDLQARLSQFISPFDQARPFTVSARVNGEDLDLVEISTKLLQAATSEFRFAYQGGNLSVTCRYGTAAFRPPNPAEQPQFAELIGTDRGQKFFEWLSQDPKLVERLGASYSPKGEWCIEAKTTRDLDKIGNVSRRDGILADPGPFEGQISSFDLGRVAVRELGDGIFSGLNEIVKRQSGVRVFRDGFAIRPYGLDDKDWLRLGAAWTGGSSYYGLKPNNIVGYIAISARDNAQLVEKTDREGFVDTPESRNFFLAVSEIVHAINYANEQLNRRYLAFKNQHERADNGLRPGADAVFQKIRDTASTATKISSTATRLQQLMDRTSTASKVLEMPKTRRDKQTSDVVRQLNELLAQSKPLLAELSEYSRRVGQLTQSASMLEYDLSIVREQMQQFAELAALGLAAESVAHELRSISSGLAARTRNILAHMRKAEIADAELIAYAEHVRSAISALQKQLGHLAPALRYLRERIDVFSARQSIENLCDFHREGLSRLGIRIDADQRGEDFTVRMSRGKLTQVLDNLVANSKYWLAQDLASRNIDDAAIHLVLEAPAILVWDTGRGVDQNIEASIFEPFITNKPKGQGRGLGLFISRQLLESSACEIDLLPDRNRFGARYIFRVDLSGAIPRNG